MKTLQQFITEKILISKDSKYYNHKNVYELFEKFISLIPFKDKYFSFDEFHKVFYNFIKDYSDFKILMGNVHQKEIFIKDIGNECVNDMIEINLNRCYTLSNKFLSNEKLFYDNNFKNACNLKIYTADSTPNILYVTYDYPSKSYIDELFIEWV